MFTEWFEGNCPECRLEDRDVEMILNRADFFECPACRLQICIFHPLHAIICQARGQSDLSKDPAISVDQIDNPAGRLLSTAQQQDDGSYSPLAPGDSIWSERELREYLAIVK